MTNWGSELPDVIVSRLAAVMEPKADHMMNKLDEILEALRDRDHQLCTSTASRGGAKSTQYVPAQDASRSLALRYLRSRADSVGDDDDKQQGEIASPAGLITTASSANLSKPSTIAAPPTQSTLKLAQQSTALEASVGRLHTGAHWDVHINDDGCPEIITRTGDLTFHDQHLRHILWHSLFDAFWLSIIALNAIVMGVQLQYHALTGGYHWSNMSTDIVFAWLFVIEFGLRLVREGALQYLCGPRRAWAMFDVLVLALSFVDMYLYMRSIESTATWSLRIIRVFRVLRIARVIRGIRFMRDLRLLIVGMFNSIMSIAWTVVALIFLMYVGAVVVMSIVIEDVQEGKEYYVETWGGMATSMCTLFQVMTGDGWWTEVVTSIRVDYPFMQYLFLAYYSITAYGLLNIVTGIFVEQTLSASKTDTELLRDKKDTSTKALQSFFTDLFHIMDKDGNGEVDFDEFEACVRNPQIAFAMGHTDLKADDVLKLFLLLDKSADGVLNCDEFVKGCMMLRGQPTIADIVEHGVNTRHMLVAIQKELDSYKRGMDRVSISRKPAESGIRLEAL